MSKYKAGDKVVLTVTGTEGAVCHPYYVLNDNNLNILVSSIDKYAEPLTTYTEPLEAKIRRRAAEITRLLDENMRLKPNYENIRAKGQNEAWELARKIFDMETNDIEDIFIKEDAWNLGTVLNNYTYPEAAAKVSEWEKVKEEIKVGDIITHEEYDKDLCVMYISPDKKHYNAIDGYGTYYLLTKEMITKTGRHIDIDSFLKQIGGGDDEK